MTEHEPSTKDILLGNQKDLTLTFESCIAAHEDDTYGFLDLGFELVLETQRDLLYRFLGIQETSEPQDVFFQIKSRTYCLRCIDLTINGESNDIYRNNDDPWVIYISLHLDLYPEVDPSFVKTAEGNSKLVENTAGHTYAKELFFSNRNVVLCLLKEAFRAETVAVTFSPTRMPVPKT